MLQAQVNRFHRSVNAERDVTDASALKGYLVTSGVRRVLHRLLPARVTAGNRAWSITGPYGTGKSALCVFLSQLMSPPSFPGRNEARQVLRQADPDALTAVNEVPRSHRGLWPVIVTGAREPLQVAVLRGLRQAAYRFPMRHDSALHRQVARLHDDAVRGKRVRDTEILDVVEQCCNVCVDRQIASGLTLIIDELGKLLEFAAAHPLDSDLYLLQGLAELASRSERPMLLITVLHQDFSGYANRLSTVERAEWDKVRGRFESILFEQPAEDFLRLVATAIDSKDVASTAKGFEELARTAGKLGFGPAGTSRPELVDLLTRCWPLHPLVSLLLGHVFRKLAQNERSAFAFLTSAEPYSVTEHLAATDRELYHLHDLYDYLIHAVGDGLYTTRSGKRWAEIENALDRVHSASPLAVATLKTIGLLNAVGDSRRISTTLELLQYSLQAIATADDVKEAVTWLKSQSLIFARGYNGSFGIWEGSDIDVEERVRDARGRLGADLTIARLARKHLNAKPRVARRHLFQTGTLRSFAVEFAHPKDALDLARSIPQGVDGRILVLLPETAQDDCAARSLAVSAEMAACLNTIVGIPHTTKELSDLLREAASLEWVRANTSELEGDRTARRELRARLTDVERQLQTKLANLLRPSAESRDGCAWFHAGEEKKKISNRGLNTLISEACALIFSKTPVILNELVNRRELSSAAAGGRRNLIEAMLTKSNAETLAIDGYPPERSMYMSLLQKTGIHRQVNGVYVLTGPDNRSDAGIRSVWTAINDFFDSADETPRSLDELFALLAAPPYGVREGPAPILLCAALVAADADVALYEEGSFVPQLTVPVFERLMKAPSKYSIRRWHMSGVRATVFHQLAEMLGRTKAIGDVGKRNLLDVVRPLLKFAAKLNDYTKSTTRLRPETRAVRDALLGAREADQLLYVELPAACGFDPIPPEGCDEKLVGTSSEFLNILRHSIGELQRSYEELLSEIMQAMATAFRLPSDINEMRAVFVERAAKLRAIASDANLRSLIVRVCDGSPSSVTWVESLASLLGERPPATWRDSDRAVFEVSLARVSRLFLHLEPLAFGNSDEDKHSFRIGVTFGDGIDRERVVRILPQTAHDVERLEGIVCDAMDRAGANGSIDLRLAALARVTKNLLAVHQPRAAGEGKAHHE